MTTAKLEFYVIEPRTGRLLPRFDRCGLTPAQGIRAYREALGATLTAATQGLRDAEQPLRDAATAVTDAITQVDRILVQNPDPTSPRSTTELMEAVGGLTPTEDRETLERRVSDLMGLQVVNGVLFPRGSTPLGPLRALFQSLGITAQQCVLPDLSEDFLMVTTVQTTTETVTRDPCGTDVSAFTVEEQRIGTNISIAAAAKAARVPESRVLVRFFWIDEIKTDGATLTRLKALGITGEDLTAVLLTQQTDRVRSFLVDASVLDTLRGGRLTDQEVCRLLSRPDGPSGINPSPTADEVVGAIQSAVNSTTGANRNRAGLTDEAIEANAQGVAPAGRAGDPGLLLAATVDMARSLGVSLDPAGPVVAGIAQGVAQGPPVAVSVDGVLVEFPGDPRCQELFAVAVDSLVTLQELAQQAQEFLSQVYGVALGAHAVQTGLEYTTCLASLNLGLDISVDIAGLLPFNLQVLLAAVAGLLATFTAAVALIRGVLCIPQGLVQLLFGGVCGFKPFDFNFCPPDIAGMIDRIQTLVNLATSLITQAGGAMTFLKVDVQAGLRAALDLKTFSACAAAVVPVGISLGLAGADLTGQPNLSFAAQ